MKKEFYNTIANADHTPVILNGVEVETEVETICSTEVAEMVEVEHNKMLRSIRTYCEYLGQANIGQSEFFI